jgi:hypothetical protein
MRSDSISALPDVYGPAVYRPEEPDRFGFLPPILVGADDRPREKSFDVMSCSPRWLDLKHAVDEIVLGRHMLSHPIVALQHIYNEKPPDDGAQAVSMFGVRAWMVKHRRSIITLTTLCLGLGLPLPGYTIAALFWPGGGMMSTRTSTLACSSGAWSVLAC